MCQRVFVFPGPRPFAWPPILSQVPSLYLPVLAPNLYLPALAANLHLPAMAPNLSLPAVEWGNYGYSYHPNIYADYSIFVATTAVNNILTRI